MRAGNPSVTVIVTVRNSAATIKACIDSVLRLDYPNKKVYVTDAYSTDGTWEILKGYGKRIRLERVKGNIATGHNHMIRRVGTEFVALTDADCVVDRSWLRRLIAGFRSNAILATGGTVRTPRNVNRLQELIGRELEHRFNRFPKYVSRLPTASLCVRTKTAQSLPFDEGLDVAQETDWGFRLSGLGKIAFVPEAAVYHYHRATWKGFFKQQFLYGKFAPMVYFRKRHFGKSLGDEISRPSMALQVMLLYLSALSFLLGLVDAVFFRLSAASFAVLLVAYLFDILKLSRRPGDVLWLLAIFFVRNIAWCSGILRGIVHAYLRAPRTL